MPESESNRIDAERMDRIAKAVEREEARQQRLRRTFLLLLAVPLALGIFAVINGRTTIEEIERVANDQIGPRVAVAVDSIVPALDGVQDLTERIRDIDPRLANLEAGLEQSTRELQNVQRRAVAVEARVIDAAGFGELERVVRDSLLPIIWSQEEQLREIRTDVRALNEENRVLRNRIGGIDQRLERFGSNVGPAAAIERP